MRSTAGILAVHGAEDVKYAHCALSPWGGPIRRDKTSL